MRVTRRGLLVGLLVSLAVAAEAWGACPGWVRDHITALACGGKDDIANLQWQSIADARAKDKWERKGCPPCPADQEARPH